MEKDLQVLKKNKKSFKRFIQSFKYCYDGIRYAFYHEQNIIVMLVMGIIAIILGMVLGISYTERLVVLLLIGLILSLEMLNTAIEATVNLCTKEQKEYAKIAKDCASGAVGIASIFAFILGILIYLPKIIELF